MDMILAETDGTGWAMGWVLIIGAIIVPVCSLAVQMFQMYLDSQKEVSRLDRAKVAAAETAEVKETLQTVVVKQEAVIKSNDGMKTELVDAVKEAAKLQGGLEERTRNELLEAAILKGRADERADADSKPVSGTQPTAVEVVNKDPVDVTVRKP